MLSGWQTSAYTHTRNNSKVKVNLSHISILPLTIRLKHILDHHVGCWHISTGIRFCWKPLTSHRIFDGLLLLVICCCCCCCCHGIIVVFKYKYCRVGWRWHTPRLMCVFLFMSDVRQHVGSYYMLPQKSYNKNSHTKAI